jgi:hypothetical protein
MAKQAYVYSGTDWVPLASEVTNLSDYYTSAEVDADFQTKATNGLTLINTTSFSGVASQSINDVFSATYQNYIIRGNFSGSTGNYGNFRLRVSGADDSTSNYARQTINADSASLSTATESTTAWNQFFVYSTSNTGILEAIICNPFAAERTSYFSRATQDGTSLKIQGGRHNVTSSFTGFTLIPVTVGNTISGTIRVYGLAN